MSYSQKNNLNKALKIVRHPIFISHYNNKNKKNNKNRIIKTSEYSKTTDAVVKKPSILKYIKNNEISSAIKKKNGFNQTSKSSFVDQNQSINERTISSNFNFYSSNYNKLDKENQVYIHFNNSILNKNYCNIKSNSFKLTKVKNQYLKLKNVYNPHINYSEVVNDRKHILQTFLSQTKNNFNNNYSLIYSNPDEHKRNYISECFNTIKQNNKNNIDKGNLIQTLAENAIYNKTIDKLFIQNKKLKFNKKNNNICISIPSSFDIRNFTTKNGKFKIKTLNVADEIMREYADPLSVKKKKRITQSALFLNIDNKKNNFFRTIQKKRGEYQNY